MKGKVQLCRVNVIYVIDSADTDTKYNLNDYNHLAFCLSNSQVPQYDIAAQIISITYRGIVEHGKM